MQFSASALREKIKETARQMFLSRGYEQTRIEDILEKLEISNQTFTSFFPSKDNLLEELWSE